VAHNTKASFLAPLNGIEKSVEVTLNADEQAMSDNSVNAAKGPIEDCRKLDRAL